MTFESYLKARGYDLRRGTGAFLRRMFVECWVQPGFHLFWRVWNPAYGYMLFRIYRRIGGARRRTVATIATFLFCGLALHDLPVSLVLRRPSVVCSIAFLFYSVASLGSRLVAAPLRFDLWPRWAHGLTNASLVALGLVLGAWSQWFLG